MRVALIHGYFLDDSGSAIYVRELAHELVRQGHDVTLICQEQNPQNHRFIDSFYDLDESNTIVRLGFSRDRNYSGSCRLVRPHIGGRLLTYVAGPFPGFEAVPFQEAPDSWIRSYIKANLKVMSAVFEKWPPDLVQANHTIMQPYLAAKALRGRAPYVVTVHGSALNFSVKADPRLIPYAIEGLEEARAVVSLSETSLAELLAISSENGLDIKDKSIELPPGVDTELFAPLAERSEVLSGISSSIDPLGDDILVFAGRLLWTKGIQYAVAAMPMILRRRPKARLIIAGEGPMQGSLDQLIGALEEGDIAAARQLAAFDDELKNASEYGMVLPQMGEEEESEYLAAARGNFKERVHFTGHISHERLAPLFGAADLSLAPSVFPEAFGLVSIEALAAGALPVATYQTGLRAPLEKIAGELRDEDIKQLRPGAGLTEAIAGSVISLLDRYETRDGDFRNRLHGIAGKHYSWRIVSQHYLKYGKPGV